jgi:hypothetical protein
MYPNNGSPFPSEMQEQLLKAALLTGDEMLGAWKKWKASVDFERDIEYASFRMLPLLYYNLSRQHINDRLMPRLKGIYRQAWSKNHLLFYKAAKVISLLNDAGIPTILLKGIALTVLVYKNYAVRPMADMDILIPKAFAGKTISLLKSKGWKMEFEHYLEYNLKYGRSITFRDREKTELDLHWHPIFEAHDSITDDDFRSRAIEMEVAGVKTLSLGITDMLFHTIVHGLRYNPEPPIRWVADATVLIQKFPQQIDWDRIIHHAKKFRVFLQINTALNYLNKNFQVEIPESVLRELGSIQPAFADRLVFKHARKYGDRIPVTLYEKLYTLYAGYLRQTSKTGFWDQHAGFVRYLRFRTKGKPHFKILMYHLSLLFKNHTSERKKGNENTVNEIADAGK